MDLLKALKNETPRKGQYYSHEIDTGIGVMQVNLRNGHLACNFFDDSAVAKLVFGHWKVNKIVYNEQDIKNHIEYIHERIRIYKEALKNGAEYYPTKN